MGDTLVGLRLCSESGWAFRLRNRQTQHLCFFSSYCQEIGNISSPIWSQPWKLQPSWASLQVCRCPTTVKRSFCILLSSINGMRMDSRCPFCNCSCWYILENPQAHTFVTIAHHLLERNIPFCMLLALPCSPCQKKIAEIYTPSSHRKTTHQFTVADFKTAMLHCQVVLSLPQGCAALLQGGIISRITKEYLSVDGVLAGPSLEVTVHHVGYLGSLGTNGILYCDDELTENEIAAICGTYTLYTGKLVFLLYIVLSFDNFLQALGFKKLYGPGFLFLPLGMLFVLDSGQLTGWSNAKLGSWNIWQTFVKVKPCQNPISTGSLPWGDKVISFSHRQQQKFGRNLYQQCCATLLTWWSHKMQLSCCCILIPGISSFSHLSKSILTSSAGMLIIIVAVLIISLFWLFDSLHTNFQYIFNISMNFSLEDH